MNNRIRSLTRTPTIPSRLSFEDESRKLLSEATGFDASSFPRDDTVFLYAFKAKIHKCIPAAGYSASFSLTDTEVCDQEIHYRVRVLQRNGQCAWSSPIWFMPERRKTLMELLEITDHTAGEKPGGSFAPLLENGRHGERESIAVYDEYGAVRMIRTNEWKYVHRYRLGCNQLFNLIEDPDEERNLATIPKFGKIMKELRILMEDWFLEYSDPEMDGRKERVTGRGQLAPIGSQATDDARFADDWKHLSSISPSFPISL